MEQNSLHRVVPVREEVRLNSDRVPNDPFRREPAAVHLRTDLFNDDPGI